MKVNRGAGALLAFVLLAVAGTSLATARDVTPDDTAKFLAGLAPAEGSPLQSLTHETSWRTHAKVFDQSWQALEQRQLSKVRSWARANLPAPQPVMFYMFSGPDFLYANAFFPGASTYVLSGLEPVGTVPDLRNLTRSQLAHSLGALRTSLNSVMSYSFFITKAMQSQLSASPVRGTLPVMLVFLARTGNTIHDVQFVDLDQNGQIKSVQAESAKSAPGVQIVFSGPSGSRQTLYYFQTDLSNAGVKKSPFLTFCKTLGSGDSFVKSASYLMHSDQFSIVRDFILANSQTLLQDDSGVPIRYFARDEWSLKPFGRYVGPIPIFAGMYQKQLAELFRPSTPRLDFGIGYRWRTNESNLLLALRKSHTATHSD